MKLKEKILNLISGGQLKFKSYSSLFASLETRLNEKAENISAALNLLLSSGELYELSGRTLVRPETIGIFKGEIVGNSKGFAFVKSSGREDCFIPAKSLMGALDGDTVLFKQHKDSAEVVKILKRANVRLVGKIVEAENGKAEYFKADNTKFSKLVYISNKEMGKAKPGDTVLVELTYQPENCKEKPVGRVVKVLDGSEVEIAIENVLAEKDIPKFFSSESLEETNKLFVDLEKEKKKRIDLTNEIIFTIDGEDAKDLDDAISVEKIESGYVLGVHIADVGNFVKKDSLLDKEAFYRATSVYFPGKVYPMLPEKLSNNLCSLNANEEKLALSVIMNVGFDGIVESYEIFESVIKSTQRLTYTQVFNFLENKENNLKPEVQKSIKEMQELSNILTERRKKEGSLDFDIAECEFVFDENENVIDVKKREINKSHKLIENFMVLCNEIVAKCFCSLDIPFVYRVHESPLKTKFDQMLETLKLFGVNFKRAKKISPQYVQDLLKLVNKTENADIESKLILRAMEKAVYSENCDGHFGLGLDFYCHFTSPIRRYPDLTIHRIIKDVIKNANIQKIESKKLNLLKNAIKIDNLYSLEEFVYESSIRSSERERNADDAERDVDDIFKASLMKQKVGEIFDGIISSVLNFGIFVELENTVEGLIKLENLPNDNYIFDSKLLKLTGNLHEFKIGDKVKIKVVNSNITNHTVDFEIVGE
ncbi:MAG: ribonuclease R [Clostridia bacterium]|nr:ribonuclease R [Clostridia bacterium]